MSWLSSWFKRDKTKLFLKLITKAAMVLLGKMARDLYDITRECVDHSEDVGGTGVQKWNNAWKCVKKKVGEPEGVAKYLIKIFIEAIVVEIKKNKNEITF